MCAQCSSALQMLRSGVVLVMVVVSLLPAPATADYQDKRGNWNKAVGLWGKRSLEPLLETNLEKRPQNQWNKLNSLWGKRSSWQTANGLWGKRSSWQTANGLWGKRSLSPDELDAY